MSSFDCRREVDVSSLPMTQLIAILTIPLIAFGCYLIMGRGVLQGYVGLALGISSLILLSVAKGAFHFGWISLTGDAPGCSVSDFYGLSGDVGCSPAAVAGAYAFIFYGVVNLALSGFNAKDPNE